jgi:RNA polymerase sigma factor (sigma-70 family)
VKRAAKHPQIDGEAHHTTRTTDIDLTTEARERLEAAFAKLPPFTRNVFLAHRLDDLSYAEIATITGVSVRRIEREMVRAIVAIDRALWEQPRRRPWWRWRKTAATIPGR